jgi:hypothetical protein
MMPGNIKTAGASLAGRKPVVQSPVQESRLPSPAAWVKPSLLLYLQILSSLAPGLGALDDNSMLPCKNHMPIPG